MGLSRSNTNLAHRDCAECSYLPNGITSSPTRIVRYMFPLMGSRKPHRHEVIDKEFPVRLTVLSEPSTHERTRQWLQRHVGVHNYASKPQVLWSGRRALCVYFRTVHEATMFLVGCPHISLVGESYHLSER